MGEYLKNIWSGLWTTLVGMKITWGHLFVPNVTVQYPDESYPIPDNARNRLKAEMDACTGCKLCAQSCPVNCIMIDTAKIGPEEDAGKLRNGNNRKMWVLKFDIDFAKCCFCGLCSEACPTDAIKTTTFFEYSTYDRNNLLYSFSEFKPEEAKAKKAQLAKMAADAVAKKAAEVKE